MNDRYTDNIGAPWGLLRCATVWGLEWDQAYIDALIARKKLEDQHRLDGKSENKRQKSGVIGENAAARFYHQRIPDRAIGESRDFEMPDLMELGWGNGGSEGKVVVGVKSADMAWPYPIIHPRQATYPYLIVFVDYISGCSRLAGLATPELLLANLDEEHVLDDNALAKGKRAFIASNLISVRPDSIAEIAEISKNYKWVKSSKTASRIG